MKLGEEASQEVEAEEAERAALEAQAEEEKEVGVRKVLGAFPKQLVRQYLSESIVTTFCAMIIGLVLYEIFKANLRLMPREWLVDFYYSPGMWAAVLGLILGVGFCAGLYPAIYLSQIGPMTILQKKTGIKSRKSRLRKALVIFQFGLAIVFMICTITVPPNPDQPASAPARTLRLRDLIAMVVGVVIGVGIFKTPPLVAGNLGSETMVVASWLLGGAVSLIGALCYAELATAYSHAGGDYHFLARAFGRNVSFLYGWARVTVITSGSIAFLGFALGDYASALLPLGAASATAYAVLAVVLFTALNAKGIHEGKTAQNLLTSLEALGLLLIAAAGWPLAAAPPAASASASAPTEANLGLAMVGWLKKCIKTPYESITPAQASVSRTSWNRPAYLFSLR